MKHLQKWLLALAVAGLVIGIPVTFTHARLGPLWTLALPLGMVFLGLYLISLLLRSEVNRFDAEQRLKAECSGISSTARAAVAVQPATPSRTPTPSNSASSAAPATPPPATPP
jgi:hypothetical protein